jgi:hypothetical protein
MLAEADPGEQQSVMDNAVASCTDTADVQDGIDAAVHWCSPQRDEKIVLQLVDTVKAVTKLTVILDTGHALGLERPRGRKTMITR